MQQRPQAGFERWVASYNKSESNAEKLIPPTHLFGNILWNIMSSFCETVESYVSF